MKLHRPAALSLVALLGFGCTATVDSDDSEVEQQEAALDDSSGKTAWAVTARSQYAFALLGLDRSGNIFVRTTLENRVFKYDVNGRLLWQRSLSLPDRNTTVEAAVVDADGNIVIAGDQRTDEEPPSTHLYDHYLAKLAPDGSTLFRRTWARAEDTAVFPEQIAVDDAQSIWVIGTAIGNADLGGRLLSGGADEGVRTYLAKYSSRGAIVFAKTGPVTARAFTAETQLKALAASPSGGVWIAGWLRRSWDLGCGTLQPKTPLPDDDYMGTGFVAKLASDGSCVLQRAFGNDVAPTAIAHSTDGRVAIGGTFRGTMSFGGASLSNGTASPDMFLATFDASSGAVGWVKRASGNTAQYVDGVAFDRSGYVAVVGRINAAPDAVNRSFKLGTFATSMDGEAWHTIVGRFTPRTGATAWVRDLGDQVLSSSGVAVSSNNRVMVAGWFTGPTDFGKGTVGAPGERRRFLMRVFP